MKVIIFSVGDTHGAYEAAYRIAKFLIEDGHQVALMVQEKTKSDGFIIPIPRSRSSILKRITNKVFPSKSLSIKLDGKYYFLNEDENQKFVSDAYIFEKLPFKPDLIIAGLISRFINTDTLASLHEKTGAVICMITVDMAPLTGGCHYAWDCRGYETDCRSCPAILEESKKNRAKENLRIKTRNVRKAHIQVIAASGWTLNQASRSALFGKQQKICNTNSFIDTELFNSSQRDTAKNAFGLPEHSKVIFTGSFYTHDERKGITYFVEGLKRLWELVEEGMRGRIVILIAGNQTASSELTEQIPFQKHLVDYIHDYELLSLAYQASDIFVCPSIEDSGPMMVSEALACGTPVVGFEMGVVSNMVINGYNGYKAELKNSDDLANGIFDILSLSEEQYRSYSRNAVTQVENFSSRATLLDAINQTVSQK